MRDEVGEEKEVELWTELCLTGSLIDYYFRQARIALTRPLNPIHTLITAARLSPWQETINPDELLVNRSYRQTPILTIDDISRNDLG